ncbi:hypothetical protein RCL1_001704 [Eukaryota sp. TZLM3-RCL]
MPYAIGIDLGTTNSCVSVFRNNSLETIASEQGSRTTPSMVGFSHDSEELFIGTSARLQRSDNPENTIYAAKRLIGRRYDDKEIASLVSEYPFTVINNDSKPLFKVTYNRKPFTISPVEISAHIIGYLKTSAESYLGEEVKHCVITVPANFGDSERQATRDAAAFAGLEVLSIINEPTAAGIAFKHLREEEEDSKVVIFDFGGGTFDVSVLEISGSNINIIASDGNSHLGGVDIDKKLIDYSVDQFKAANAGSDPTRNKEAMSRLAVECEKAKEQLSTAQEFFMEVTNLHNGFDFDYEITRPELDRICNDLYQSCLGLVNHTLEAKGLEPSDIDHVIMIGGSSRIPKLHELITDRFGKAPLQVADPDEAVASGAAIRAHFLLQQKLKQSQSTVQPSESRLVIESPKIEVFEEPVDVITLNDVLTNSFSTDVESGVSILLRKNTTLPCCCTKRYATVKDNQPCVSIKIFEGESPKWADNTELGQFNLPVTPAPARSVMVEVTFSVDVNGILSVTAIELGGNSKKSITIGNENTQYSKVEIDEELFRRLQQNLR